MLDNVNVNTEKSFCNIKESLANLVVIEDVDDGEESPYSLLFNFTAVSWVGVIVLHWVLSYVRGYVCVLSVQNNKSEVWNFGNMIFTLENDTLLTEGYNSTGGMFQ